MWIIHSPLSVLHFWLCVGSIVLFLKGVDRCWVRIKQLFMEIRRTRLAFNGIALSWIDGYVVINHNIREFYDIVNWIRVISGALREEEMKLFVSYIVILIHWVVPTMLLNQFGGQHLIFAGFHVSNLIESNNQTIFQFVFVFISFDWNSILRMISWFDIRMAIIQWKDPTCTSPIGFHWKLI